MLNLIPINSNSTQRNTDWICICSECQHERIISYAQKWNIEVGKSPIKCRSCITEKWKTSKHKNLTDKYTFYNNLFNNPSKNPKTKEKMRNAKLGKFGKNSNRWLNIPLEEKKQKTRKTQDKYKADRLKRDPVFRAMNSLRNRVSEMIRKNNLKSYSKKLGCNLMTLKAHIEQQFQPGMTWENYGKWHMDHIYPLSIAAKQTTEIFLKACHYTNLQPLWAIDNIKKGNSLDYL